MSLRDALSNAQKHNIDVQEARRKLHHELQELKGSIRVFGRVRPLGVPGASVRCGGVCMHTGT